MSQQLSHRAAIIEGTFTITTHDDQDRHAKRGLLLSEDRPDEWAIYIDEPDEARPGEMRAGMRLRIPSAVGEALYDALLNPPALDPPKADG